MITRRTVLAAAGSLVAAPLLISGKAQAMITPPAIFLSCHSDDSFLSMSTEILNHIDQKRQVIIVLVTAGGSQGMLDTLNGDIIGYGEPKHNPKLENYMDNPFTPETVTRIRIEEFNSEVGGYRLYAGNESVSAMIKGAPEGISQQACYDSMLGLAKKYPGASFKTMSYSDPNPDHAACGKALQQLVKDGIVKDARWFVNRDYEHETYVKKLNPWNVYATPTQATAIRSIGRAYTSWNPAGGSYSYGYISVRNSFDTLFAKPYSIIHS